MKVREITEGQTIQEGLDVSKKKASVGSKGFQDLLVEELNTTTGSEKDDGMALQGIGPMNVPVSMYSHLNGSFDDHDRGMTTEAIQSLSENLDDIERSIGDGKANLETVDKMIERLSREAEGFRESVDGLPAEHPLRQAGDQLSVLAYVESVKWRRGDYL